MGVAGIYFHDLLISEIHTYIHTIPKMKTGIWTSWVHKYQIWSLRNNLLAKTSIKKKDIEHSSWRMLTFVLLYLPIQNVNIGNWFWMKMNFYWASNGYVNMYVPFHSENFFIICHFHNRITWWCPSAEWWHKYIQGA